MQSLLLTIVTEHQSQMSKAKKLSELLELELGNGWEMISINTYYKFENSYKIEFKKAFPETGLEELNLISLSLTAKIASP